MKVLLVHPPRWERPPGGKTWLSIMAMPLGLLPLAGLLRRAGHQVSVVHWGVEAALAPDGRDPGAALEQTARQLDPDLCGVVLHWHQQLPAALEAARRLRAACPRARLMLGGMTAGALAGDLLQQLPELDFVVQGEAELPLLTLAGRLQDGRDPAGAPGLWFRQGDRIRQPPALYHAASEELDALDDADDSNLVHGRWYTGQERLEACPRALRQSQLLRLHYPIMGRGCTAGCAFCGGNREAHRRSSGRAGPSWRSPEVVASSIRRATAAGRNFIFFSFDPPGAGRERYHDLFARLASEAGEGLTASAAFEVFGQPPDRAFLEALGAAFPGPFTAIYLSPHALDPRQRQAMGCPPVSEQQWEECIAQAAEAGVAVRCYLSSFPGDDWPVTLGTARWAHRRRRREDARVCYQPMEVEPLSGWSDRPGAFGVKPGRTGLDAYLEAHRPAWRPPASAGRLGYGDARLQARVLFLLSQVPPIETAPRQDAPGRQVVCLPAREVSRLTRVPPRPDTALRLGLSELHSLKVLQDALEAVARMDRPDLERVVLVGPPPDDAPYLRTIPAGDIEPEATLDDNGRYR